MLPGDRRDQPLLEQRRARARVLEQEVAGAVGVLAQARLVAGLAEQRGLLVARHAARPGRCRRTRSSRPYSCALPTGSGSEPIGTSSRSHSSSSHAPLADVEQQRARRVGVVGHVLAGELEDQPRVDRAEQGVARRPRPSSAASGTWCRRSRRRARARCARGTSARGPASRSSSQRPAVRRSCQTIARCSGSPLSRSQATAVSRWLVMPMPSRSSPVDAGVLERLVADPLGHLPDLARRRARPSPGRGKCCSNSE